LVIWFLWRDIDICAGVSCLNAQRADSDAVLGKAISVFQHECQDLLELAPEPFTPF